MAEQAVAVPGNERKTTGRRRTLRTVVLHDEESKRRYVRRALIHEVCPGPGDLSPMVSQPPPALPYSGEVARRLHK